MNLNSIVAINISLSTASVQQKGFGRGLILGGSNRLGSDLYRIYTSTAGMKADGFLTSDPEYKAAAAYFGQKVSPKDVMVGYAPTNVKQVNTLTPTPADATAFTVTLNGVAYTHTTGTGETATDICDALRTLLAGVTEVVCTGTSTLIITAATAGVGFSVTTTANIANVATTANVGVDTALDNILAAGGKNWYGLVVCSHSDSDIKVAAAWIEAASYDYIFAACSEDSDIITSVTTDLLSYLKGKNYLRTFLLWSDDLANFPEAAWMGYLFTFTPGSANWANKTLVGITATAESVMTDSAIANIEGKKGNYYTLVDDIGITRKGVMVGNEWIDVIIGRDWIKSDMQAGIFEELLNNPKIGFDDDGIGILANRMRQTLQKGVDNKILASFTLDVPLASSFSDSVKATRVLPSIPFTGVLDGAINEMTVTGNLTN